jgi:hypothetical protein
MSRDEVISILGGSPGDYSNGRCISIFTGIGYESWICDDGELLVRFDTRNCASDVVICDVWSFPPPTLLQRLRSWLTKY